MPSDKPKLEKVTIRTFEGDCAELQSLFPKAGYNKVIRHMVRNLIKQVKEKAQQHSLPADFTSAPIDIDTIAKDASNDTND